MKYRIEISASESFATLLHYQEVDQPTYTPFTETLPEGDALVARAGHRRRQQRAGLEHAGPGGEEVGRGGAHRAEERCARGGYRAVLDGSRSNTRRLPARGLQQQRHDLLLSQPGPERGHEDSPRTSRRSTFPPPRRPTCGGSAGSTRATGRVPGPTATRSAWCPVSVELTGPASGAYVRAERSRPVLAAGRVAPRSTRSPCDSTGRPLLPSASPLRRRRTPPRQHSPTVPTSGGSWPTTPPTSTRPRRWRAVRGGRSRSTEPDPP